ncbi:AbrB/MazE/SpoVT family DNA-binding domain-containing protein [Longimicrobium sp.]|uniref:AbrB/MazE/SpoVT family DNA-binding domain-containing protein n=1 Tax=Longimicrobium sp. TaxID=2029185 RepID=UPI002B77A815|nr:AbrB/MazE/SpoVT family DNA-binding domain-containing protein [Longimicrobium sp.]HSU18017.1 AbrB/MazE/SpoVT family DNA-binding domain-containing protein [Longimicrobium sp.]
MCRARLDSECKAVIPASVRETLGVGPGDEIVFTVTEGRVVVSNGKSVLDRLAKFAGPMWRGYADEVRRDRDECDR